MLLHKQYYHLENHFTSDFNFSSSGYFNSVLYKVLLTLCFNEIISIFVFL